jgi:hypothetical protein
VDFCEHGNEPTGPTKGAGVLVQLDSKTFMLNI